MQQGIVNIAPKPYHHVTIAMLISFPDYRYIPSQRVET
jgi:hypothetical protein